MDRMLKTVGHQPASFRTAIISDDPYGGHRAAAKAVREALDSYQPSQSEDTKIFEFHELCSGLRTALNNRYYALRNTSPRLARPMFQSAMNPSWFYKSMWKAMTWIQNAVMPEAHRMVAAHEPDVVLSVHMCSNQYSQTWQDKGQVDAPVHSLVTDYVAQSVWKADNIQHYYVATPQVREDLVGYGIDPERISVTGIPISPQLAAPDHRPQAEVKTKLGLDPNLPTVLVMGGSKGDQKYEEILGGLARNRTPVQVVALCGRNEARRQEVEDFAAGLDLPVKAVPFVEMRDYYKASDVVISKPGGLTTTEVMAQGKPLVMVSPYPGMEEENVRRLVDAGVAVFGETPDKAADAVHQLIGAPDQCQRLGSMAQAFVNPNAAHDIALHLLAAGPKLPHSSR
ncbi:MAG: glycosyltransferase [Vulcanimicrobiota bacterium]